MVPPLVGVAVNVAEEPAHIGLVPEVCAIATDGVTFAFTVTATAFEVAVVGVAQFALEVITQVTDCPLVSDVVVNVVAPVPAFTPSTFH